MHKEPKIPIDHNFHLDISEKYLRWEERQGSEYHEYRRAWNENPKNFIVGRIPIHLDIEATSHCNLRCTMCPRTEMVASGEFWEEKRFPIDKFYEIIDECVSKGLKSVKFQYLGEPLLNKKIHEMVRYCKDKGVVDVMYNTNAVALTEGVAKKIFESGLDKIFFSFDSPYREEFNSIRIDGDYDKILDNIKRFVRLRESFGLDKPVTRVSMVKLNESDQKYRDFVTLFEDEVDGIASLDLMDHDLDLKKIDEKYVWAEIDAELEHAEPNSSQKLDDASFCCPQLWQRMFVHPDGVVTPCCLDASRSLKMGNVTENSVEEIWNGDRYKKMRALHKAGKYKAIKTCKQCPLAKSGELQSVSG